MRAPLFRSALLTLFSAALLAIAGCAPAPLYKPAPGTVHATPMQVAQTPEDYMGKPVIWGGRVVEVRNFPDHSEIQVLAYPLDGSQRPLANDTGNGRFLIRVPGYVERLDYPDGSLVTVYGTIRGVHAGKVGEADYLFPLVDAQQLHHWTAEELRAGHPHVSFGVGVGIIR